MQVEAKEIVSLGAVIKQLQKTYTGLKHVRLENYQFKEQLRDTFMRKLMRKSAAADERFQCQGSSVQQ